MNSKFIFYLLFFLSTNIIFSQKCFTVYENHSEKVIPYATILKENKAYTNSDADGKFCIADSDLLSEFNISCIGYETEKLDMSKDIIFLNTSTIQLKEIIIKKPTFKKKYKLGSYKKSNIALSATYDLSFAEAGRVFILNNPKQQFLKKIKFHTFSSLPNRILGIKIYSLNDNNEPKDLLSTENIVIDIKKGTQTATVDLSKSPFPVPKEGFVVSLQILLLEQNKQYGERNKFWYFYEPSIGATNNIPGASYFSSAEEGVWKKHDGCQLNIQVELTN